MVTLPACVPVEIPFSYLSNQRIEQRASGCRLHRPLGRFWILLIGWKHSRSIAEALKYLQRSTTRFGALRWSAPELVETDEHFNQTPKSDVYSFGCVALEASWFDTDARSVLISLQVFSGKLPWSELRGDASVLLQLMKGEKPGRPESQAIDDSRWNFIQECWSSIEERPDADVIISTVQQFFSDCPEFPPLCELLLSRSSEGDAQMDASSPSLSPSKATAEDSRTNVGDLDDNSLT